MNILDAYQAINDALDAVHAKQREQLSKDDLMDATIYTVELQRFLTNYPGRKSILSFVFERLFSAIRSAQEVDKEILPDSIKELIVLALLQAKNTLASMIYSEYRDQQISDDDIDLFTDVICTVRGFK